MFYTYCSFREIIKLTIQVKAKAEKLSSFQKQVQVQSEAKAKAEKL
jgi:hypothetical protein